MYGEMFVSFFSQRVDVVIAEGDSAQRIPTLANCWAWTELVLAIPTWNAFGFSTNKALATVTKYINQGGKSYRAQPPGRVGKMRSYFIVTPRKLVYLSKKYRKVVISEEYLKKTK